jgi:DNA-binding XRE family transcriptional regulator
VGKSRRRQPKHLAKKLKLIRRRLDIGQAEMAERLKRVEDTVHPGSISRFETGKLEPSLIVLLEYSRLAGCSMETLVDDKLRL